VGSAPFRARLFDAFEVADGGAAARNLSTPTAHLRERGWTRTADMTIASDRGAGRVTAVATIELSSIRVEHSGG